MKLENLVPSLQNCRKIPAGKFNDSALVWVRYRDKQSKAHLCSRENLDWLTLCPMDKLCPAPTLAEIMAELVTAGVAIHGVVIGGNDEYSITTLPYDSQHTECDVNPADAALRLVKKIHKRTQKVNH